MDMPINWNGDYIESKADKKRDMLGFREVGGVGQLIYHQFRFANYSMTMNTLDVEPVCDADNIPDLTTEESLSGIELLNSLCNLAQEIDSPTRPKGYPEMILDWCMKVTHPYNIDEVYAELTEPEFDITGFDAELVARDAAFSINDFVNDLGSLYRAVKFYIALQGVCLGKDDEAYHLDEDGSLFDGLPFFSPYKVRCVDPDIDVSAANGDLRKEIMIRAEYEKSHPEEFELIKYEGEFVDVPYDDYEELRDKLIDWLPDFKLRLKISPETNKPVLAAEVHSVFDIAWYTLAWMISEDPAPEDMQKHAPRKEGVITRCACCGEIFTARNRNQKYCKKEACVKSRKAKNAKDKRDRDRVAKAQMTK